VSLVLAADARAYVSGLTAYRDGRSGERIDLLARAIERAGEKATDLAARLAEFQAAWRERSGKPRRHSGVEALIVALPSHPIIKVATGQLAVSDCIHATSASFGCLVGEHHSAGRFILLSSAV
jgi:hypothetical protein